MPASGASPALRPASPALRSTPARPAGEPGCAAADTAADRATPARSATGRCAAGARHRPAARPATARRNCARPRRRRPQRRDSSTPCRESRSSAASISPRVVRRQHAGPGERTRPRQAPVTSSSKSRRSKRNEEPHSNAAASGAVSNRPDQSVVIASLSVGHCDVGQAFRAASLGRQSETLISRPSVIDRSPASRRDGIGEGRLTADDTAIAFE